MEEVVVLGSTAGHSPHADRANDVVLVLASDDP